MDKRILIALAIVFIGGLLLVFGFMVSGLFLFQSGGTANIEPPVNPEVQVQPPESGNSVPEPPTQEDDEELAPSLTPTPLPEFTPSPTYTLTPTFTPTPETINRCELFDSRTSTLTLHDVPYFTRDLTFFVDFGHPVPGLEEPVSGDDADWIYTGDWGVSNGSLQLP